MATERLASSCTIEELTDLILGPSGHRPRPSREMIEARYVVLPSSDRWASRRPSGRRWHLRMVSGDDPQMEMAIALRGDVVLGVKLNPGDDVDVDLNVWNGYELGVSRRHLVLRPSEFHLFAADLDSTNGSTINGTSMIPSSTYPLRTGDVLSLAGLHVQIAQVEQARAAAAEFVPGPALPAT